MKYPSQYLEDLVPIVDRLEDDLLDRFNETRAWLAGWKVWEWVDQAQRIDTLKHQNRMLVEELKSLREKYRAETGKPPPGGLTLVLADHEGVGNAMAAMRRALANLRARRG